jgi:hypothetical protein
VLVAPLVGCSSSNPSADSGHVLDRPPPSETGGPSLPLKAEVPGSPVRLVFVHHSVGEGWAASDGGDLRARLNQNRYFMTDTNYGWGPDDLEGGGSIGDHTDIGHWSRWFLGPHRDTYLAELYRNSHLTDGLGPNSIPDPGGSNTVVLFKSCFLSAQVVGGSAGDAPAPPGNTNPIYGKDSSDHSSYTVANIKGLYRDLLEYFASRQDKLFVLITTPPSRPEETSSGAMTNLRDINTWLVRSWLEKYPHRNVAVFDLGTVLTSNGGDPDQNDVDAPAGGHHRYRAGAVEHLLGPTVYLAYPTEDSHPTAAGTQKATVEFLPLLNIAYHCWKGSGGCPRLMGRP